MAVQVCNHQFHSECLKGWGDTSCPVCRYCHETSAAQSHCQVCCPHPTFASRLTPLKLLTGTRWGN